MDIELFKKYSIVTAFFSVCNALGAALWHIFGVRIFALIGFFLAIVFGISAYILHVLYIKRMKK